MCVCVCVSARVLYPFMCIHCSIVVLVCVLFARKTPLFRGHNVYKAHGETKHKLKHRTLRNVHTKTHTHTHTQKDDNTWNFNPNAIKILQYLVSFCLSVSSTIVLPNIAQQISHLFCNFKNYHKCAITVLVALRSITIIIIPFIMPLAMSPAYVLL